MADKNADGSRVAAARRKVQGVARSARVTWAPSLTRRLLRHRWLWAGVTVVVAIAAFGAVRDQQLRFDEHAAAWGRQASVVQVVAEVQAGDPVASAVEIVQRPLAMIPDAALREMPAPGALAKADLFVGEFLIEARLVTSADVGVRDQRSMTVAIEGPATLVEVGDLIDLWAADPRQGHAVEVVANVVVLERSDDDLTIAVPRDQVGAVAAAALQPLTVARVG